MHNAYGFTAYRGPEVERFLDLPLPSPGPGELLVEVRAAGVNPVDWKVREEMHRSFLPLGLPAVFGREAAGVVVGLGPGAEGFAVGDAVFGSSARGCGGYAHHAVLTADCTIVKPDGLSYTDAAALPVAAVQLAASEGVSVVGTASGAQREFVSSLGATAVPYDSGDTADRLAAALPNGADAVLDLVGGEALDTVSGVLSPGCRVLTVAAPDTAARFGARPLSRGNRAEALGELARRVRDRRLDPHVREVFPFAEAPAALRAVESGHPWGKVVLVPAKPCS
ncbi:NADP-dependent oxidoreductase [Streptomyces rugosispiralis]|uniref:NADP-dependent oxidoreductase n=1 Tax=Streptomyces rugosispiralis TaxID=2967341 RepID=A0ABT1V1I9_9ACTN|nr:NADP-dependent oxidoreductase [Streptomyces rugosispiralis]MCQ8191238.1 NADP-dependent oxidoreductase [Streptomyces rugosispiralis]